MTPLSDEDRAICQAVQEATGVEDEQLRVRPTYLGRYNLGPKHLGDGAAMMRDAWRSGESITSRDGREYIVAPTGQLVRVRPVRPWNSKRERRMVLTARRVQRAFRELEEAIA